MMSIAFFILASTLAAAACAGMVVLIGWLAGRRQNRDWSRQIWVAFDDLEPRRYNLGRSSKKEI